MKIAIIGTYPPRQCGIATFTHDLYKSITQISPTTAVVAISDGSESSFPEEVCFVIDRDSIESYGDAALFLNATFDVVLIQHEYGIFGGKAGHYILELVQGLSIPIVTNFHTVLQDPGIAEKRIIQFLSSYSSKVTVMTRFAIDLLEKIHGVRREKIVMIHHGVPDFPYNQEEAKLLLGLVDKKVMLTFGFLGPGKGLETAIEAVAAINDPDFTYIILGSTHPYVLRDHGEAYRKSLQKKAQTLRVADRIKFIDCFATEEMLVQYLSACDIYVTPYLNENQICSGTLAFAVGAGAAVISTPYWYAKDLLSDETGLLFDFKDSKGLSHLINILLKRPKLLSKYRNNAGNIGEEMRWSNVGKRYMMLLRELDNHSTELMA